MGDAFDATAGHLTGQQAAWMAHWLRLVELEEAGLPDKRSEIWALPGALLHPPQASGQFISLLWTVLARLIHELPTTAPELWPLCLGTAFHVQSSVLQKLCGLHTLQNCC